MNRQMQVAGCAVLAAAVGAGVGIGVYRAVAPAAAACPAGTAGMQRLELLFGMGRKEGGEVSEAEWRAFLDSEVTPKFPNGLTVLTGYGQWRGGTGSLVKETSRLLLIWVPHSANGGARIEAIRAAYKSRFGQESVLRAEGRSCVSF
jgi:hypothetical protein